MEGVTSAWGKVAEHGVVREKFWGDPGMCIEITKEDGGCERALEGEGGQGVVGGGEVVRRGSRGEIDEEEKKSVPTRGVGEETGEELFWGVRGGCVGVRDGEAG